MGKAASVLPSTQKTREWPPRLICSFLLLIVVAICSSYLNTMEFIRWSQTHTQSGVYSIPPHGMADNELGYSQPAREQTSVVSPLHDKTLYWDPSVRRLWVDPNLKPEEQPAAMLLLSNIGWNQPDQDIGLTIQRHRRETLLFTAVINHPWFHPTMYEEIENSNATSIPDNVRFYVFTDFYQYKDPNWPLYGKKGANLDSSFNRTVRSLGNSASINFFNMPRTVERGRLFREGHNVTHIFFDASPNGATGNVNRSSGSMASLPMSLVSLSASISNTNELMDQGLIPPAVNPANLTVRQMRDIETCHAENNRSLFFVYMGNGRSGKNDKFHKYHGHVQRDQHRWFGARRSYFKLHDNKRIFAVDAKEKILSNMSYPDILSNAVFGLASRGDNKYSYRFTEVLSAGAIPVVHADDWVWPFRPELIDWNECAVILPEKDAGNTTIRILEGITLEQRCRMRQQCWNIYKRYVETPEGTINGIIDGLELVATGKTEKMQGIRCDNYTNPIDCNKE